MIHSFLATGLCLSDILYQKIHLVQGIVLLHHDGDVWGFLRLLELCMMMVRCEFGDHFFIWTFVCRVSIFVPCVVDVVKY